MIERRVFGCHRVCAIVSEGFLFDFLSIVVF